MPKPRSPQGRALVTAARLEQEYPDAICSLVHQNAFQLLCATILSAQCTDERVNQVTPALFERYPTAEALADANPAELEALIKPTGFFRSKARNLIGMAGGLEREFAGQVPSSMEDLTRLPGVGRKTANVIRSVALDLPGLAVDTHVGRLSRRLGLTMSTDPVKVEAELNELLPASQRGKFSIRMIYHGRQICVARKPRCGQCVLADFCPSAMVQRPSTILANRR